MTSARELVDSTVNDYLLTGQRPLRAQFTSAVTDTQTTVTLTNVQGAIGPDSLLQAGFEQMGVWSYTDPAAVVLRGDNGSTAVAHAENDVVELDPEFPRSWVLSAIQEEIQTLSNNPGIWKPTTVSIPSPSRDVVTFDLGSNDVRRILDVRQLVDGSWLTLSRWRIVRGLTGETGFSGDVGLELIDLHRSGGEVRVITAGPLGTIDASTVDVAATAGVSASLLAVGAAVRMNAGRPVKRSLITAQGSSRRANEVAPYQTVNSGRELKALHKRLMQDEMTRLSQMYPHRRNHR